MDKEVKEILETYKKQRGAAPAYVEAFAEFKPEVLRDWYKMRKKIFEEGVIPRKYKELIVMAMCFARLYPAGEGHMKLAMEAGATKEEIFEVMMLAIPGVGIPPFSTAVRALRNLEGK
jgi:alkylhydroperoxidase/carboxymuconolactone decarboxylase family protein YurZ